MGLCDQALLLSSCVKLFGLRTAGEKVICTHAFPIGGDEVASSLTCHRLFFVPSVRLCRVHFPCRMC